MSTKPVVIAFLAGAGVAALVGGRFWTTDAGDRSSPAPVELTAAVEAAPDAVRATPPAVDETETLVENDEPVIESEPEAARATTGARRAPIPEPTPPRARRSAPPEPVPAPEPEAVAVEPAEARHIEPVDRSTGDVAIAEEAERADNDDWTRSTDEEPADRPVSAAVVDRPESPRAWEPNAPSYEELILSADSVISLQVDSSVTTETARVEDRVEARTIRDVKVGRETAIPAGTLAVGSVTLVERGGKIKERARLGVRFHTIVLDDGTDVPLQTETIYREGASPGKESAAKIGGGAAAGAILGGIFGGRKGAAIGSAIGAGGGTAATMAGGRNPATLPAGTPVTIRLQEPATVTVER